MTEVEKLWKRRRLSTVDLLVPTRLDQLLCIMKIFVIVASKRATLTSTLLNSPLQYVLYGFKLFLSC
jgi:hypothetical protein